MTKLQKLTANAISEQNIDALTQLVYKVEPQWAFVYNWDFRMQAVMPLKSIPKHPMDPGHYEMYLFPMMVYSMDINRVAPLCLALFERWRRIYGLENLVPYLHHPEIIDWIFSRRRFDEFGTLYEIPNASRVISAQTHKLVWTLVYLRCITPDMFLAFLRTSFLEPSQSYLRGNTEDLTYLMSMLVEIWGVSMFSADETPFWIRLIEEFIYAENEHSAWVLGDLIRAFYQHNPVYTQKDIAYLERILTRKGAPLDPKRKTVVVGMIKSMKKVLTKQVMQSSQAVYQALYDQELPRHIAQDIVTKLNPELPTHAFFSRTNETADILRRQRQRMKTKTENPGKS